MKHLLGYVIWNKVNMLDWLIEGILESFTPDQVDLLFVLDNPTDGTDSRLSEILKTKLSNFNCHVKIFNQETYKFPCQNWAMKYALDNNYKSLIAPQDDQKITDILLINNIDKVFEVYGESLGCIGMRDGFEYGYKNMISSAWSESVLSTRPRLNTGDIEEVHLINDGGIVYPCHLIKKIGFNDVETYKLFYIEDDYAHRSHLSGYKNIVLGNSLIHKKENTSFSTTHYNDNSVGQGDFKSFDKKWGL